MSRKKQTARYVIEINDWGCGTMIKDTLTGKEIDAPAEETVNLCLAEMNRLATEVERLKAVITIEQRTNQGLQQTPEWSEIARMTAECRRLEAENNRLRSSSFVTAVPVEQYERLRKAGDAMARIIAPPTHGTGEWDGEWDAWNAAKEGKDAQ